MIDENERLILSEEFLRKNKRLLIDSDEQVVKNNTKCPSCASIVTISEAFTQPCILDSGFTMPAFDEVGVIVGECSCCNKKFIVNVVNPEFAEFHEGATKIGFYFNTDSETEKDLYKELLNATSKVRGDEKLKRYNLNYIYDDHPLYICNKCGENLEILSLNAFRESFGLFKEQYDRYINWSLKNGGGTGPDYVIVKLGVKCSCNSQCTSFFFKRYAETLNFEIEEFSICNIIGSKNIENVISPGIYSKDKAISWLYKLIPRWTLLFDKVYIITPFIGHQYLDSMRRIDTWFELINRLDHRKSKVLLKYGQLSSFKKAYSKENNETYETLSEFNLGSDLLSEIKQKNDFHAKIYCGISHDNCEVFSGSANLVRGPSMEVMQFNKYWNFDDFSKAFLIPLGVEENLKQKSNTYSLLFDSDHKFSVLRMGGEIKSSKYKNIILQNDN